MYPNWSTTWRNTQRGWAFALLAAEILLIGFVLLAWPLLTQAAPSTPENITCNPGTRTNCVVISGVLSSQTWVADTIYVISPTTSRMEVHIPATATITIEPGTIVKMFAAYPLPITRTRVSLVVTGVLDIQGTSNNPVIFTSYRDDFYGGDTNGDGAITEPAPGDYLDIRLVNNSTTFANAVVRYGYYAVRALNTLAVPMTPTVSNVSFDRNFFGLMFDTASTGDINANVTSNNFAYNFYGLGAQHSYTNSIAGRGASRPVLTNNTFQNHDEVSLGFPAIPSFPIYLNGTAYPTYSGNQFLSTNRHQAIALGGSFHRSGALAAVTDSNSARIPYVVYGDVFAIAAYGTVSGTADFRLWQNATMTVPAQTVFKFYSSTTAPRYFYISGTLDLQSTSSSDRVVFTSYQDDTYAGDTNGDGTASSPNPADWQSVSLFTSATVFDYALVRYSNLGLRVYNIGFTALSPEIAHSRFEYNKFGVFGQIKSGYDITSTVHDNVFSDNLYGIGTVLEPTNNLYPGGAVRFGVSNNQFNNHREFPIYLGGTAFPTYNGNTFAGNVHPAIGLNAYVFDDGTWEKVYGWPDLNAHLPYVVTGTQALGTVGANFSTFNGVTVGPVYCIQANQPAPCGDWDTVTVLSNTVFKVDTGRNFLVDSYGDLNITANNDNERLIFTSYRDDTVIGDTNADGNVTTPTLGSWNYLNYNADQFQPPTQKVFHHALVRYATQAMRISYNGQASNNFFPEVHNVTFEQSTYGMYLYIDNAGDINSKLHDNTFISNTYGLGTGVDLAAPNTGVSRPYFYNNTIQGSRVFPIYLGGTAFPVYNNASSTAPDSNVLVGNKYTAVGLGGLFNCSGANCGSWNKVINAGIQVPFVITADVTIGNNASVGIPPGAIIKANTTGCTGGDDNVRCEVKMNGELDLQGTANNPVIFTSFRDDTAGGDTNADGTTTTPNRTDWYGITLYSNGLQLPAGTYAFDYAVLKYAQQGLRVSGAASNIYPRLAHNRFVNNQVGLQLYTTGAGNILSPINDNIFQENTISVLATRQGTAAGKHYSTLTCNDFYVGITSTQMNSMTVLVTSSVLTATNNYWGASTGPRHSSNPSGTGIVVTNVAGSSISLTPFNTDPCQGAVPNAILGRVAQVGDTPVTPLPLVGVTMLLSNGAMTTTNQNGLYNFNGLGNGTYTIQPLQNGYVFSPTSRTINLAGADASGMDFIATPVVGQVFTIVGQVRDGNGQPVPGVLVYTTNSGAGDTTDSNGMYTLSVPTGSYTVVAVLSGYQFWPNSRTVNVGPNATGQDFFVARLMFGPFIRR